MIASTGSVIQCHVSKSSPLSCLNRMIAVGLKGPSVRGASEERDREKEVAHVGGATSLINLFSIVQ